MTYTQARLAILEQRGVRAHAPVVTQDDAFECACGDLVSDIVHDDDLVTIETAR